MKIGIIGDIHFGAGFNLGKVDPATQLNTRLIDFSNTFNYIIDKFLEDEVESVVLTGDVFETRHPTSAQLNAFSVCLSRAVNKGLEFVIVVGNHDQQRTISTTTLDIFNSLNLKNVTVYADMGLHTVSTPEGPVNLFLMPYRDRRMLSAETSEDAVNMVQKELQSLRAKGDSLNPHKNIIVGHYMMGSMVGAINQDAFSINELVLPLDTFAEFDATIMGHIHQHEILSRDPVIIYSGSMEKVSFGEKAHRKISIILDTNDIKKFKIIKNNVRTLYEMNFDYSQNRNKLYKSEINKMIIQDIDEYCQKHDITGAIVKFIAKVKDNDLYYVNQSAIKDYINSKGIEYLASIQISSVVSRQLRNKDITEDISGKKAMGSYINSLTEPDAVKKKLLKYAADVMQEVGGFE